MTTRRQFVQLCSAAAVAARRSSGAPPDPAIGKAMDSVRAAIPAASADPERPAYHFHPPANWNNDPNGTIFYRGWHHLFYQFNPYGSLWGHMHWGHARSRDLVNWEHLPIALGPSEDKGEHHIFSGGAVLARDGRPRIIYTSIGDRQPEQWLAAPRDEDLKFWTKSPRNPVLTTAAHGALKVEDWRDPFLFTEAGQTYMVCGGNTSGRRWGGSGAVQLYIAANSELTEWTHLGPVFERRDREVMNIECPNLFKLNGKWVLILSPEKPCEYFVGTLDLGRPRFEPETHGILDAGNAYASNISMDDKGRALLWLWGRTDNPASKGWNSVMVMPRVLSIDSRGYLRQRPAPEFETLRDVARELPAAALGDKPADIAGVRGDCLELEVELSLGSAAAAGLELRRSVSGKPGASIAISKDGTLSMGSASTSIGRNERYRLRVFLDKRVVEVYANDGYAAMYGTTNAGSQDLGVAAFARGEGARLVAGKAWPMKAAEFSLENFQI